MNRNLRAGPLNLHFEGVKILKEFVQGKYWRYLMLNKLNEKNYLGLTWSKLQQLVQMFFIRNFPGICPRLFSKNNGAPLPLVCLHQETEDVEHLSRAPHQT